MKNIIKIVMILLLSLGYLSAQDRQFYFIGKYDRLGSQSSDATNKKGVYLRWDMIESDLPSEITTLELIRIVNDQNTTLFSSVPAHGIMKSADIQNIFMEYGSERRLFEAIDFISNNTDLDCTGAYISNIGSKVEQCLKNNYWAFLASRANFDIARARYRAYLDTGVDEAMGNVTYVLRGSNAAGTQTMILGKTNVELKASRVLKAVDFEQILASHCNDGNYALDDYRVALKWKNGGDKTNFFANGLMVSGYDIYYSTKPVEMLPEEFEKIDIASIAGRLPHNAKGEVDLSNYNLKKANDTLITVGGQAGEEKKPNYLESQADLKARGFKPGEKRYYFLVPKDFTGNYGPSISMEVQIPDMLPPATPVNPRAVENAGQFALMWENLTLKNYAAHYEDSMKLCSTVTNTQDTRYQFVDLDESCQEGNGIMVNLNIAKYYVYRFDNHAEAAAFTDSDLDGYADQDEEAKDTQCNKNLPLPKSGIENRLVGTIENTHEDTISFMDNTVQQGKVYWYRIMSATPSDMASPLTAPVRAFMPKREVLPVPEITVLSQKEFYVEINADDQAIAKDLTGMDIIDTVKLDVNGAQYVLERAGNAFSATKEITSTRFPGDDYPATFYFYAEGELIKVFPFLLYQIFDINSRTSEDGKVYYGIDGTHHSADLLSRDMAHVNGGLSSDKCKTLKFSDSYFAQLEESGACLETSMRMGLGRYNHSTNCELLQTFKVCTEQGKKGDLVSGRMSTCLPTGICSLPFYWNYVLIADETVPNSPTLTGLDLNKADLKAKVTFTPQLEKVKGTMLLLYKQGDDNNTYRKVVPHIGNKSVEPLETLIDNINEMGFNETWCLKAKTIGLNGKVSDWSAPLCKELIEENTLPAEMLSWPSINNSVKKGEPYGIAFDSTTKKIRIQLTESGIGYHDAYKIDRFGTSSPIIAHVTDNQENNIAKIRIVLYDEDNQPRTKDIIISRDENGSFRLPLEFDDISQSDLPNIEVVTLEFLTEGEVKLSETIVLKNTPLSMENIEGKEMIVSNENIGISVYDVENTCSSLPALNRVSNFVVYRQTVLEDESKSKFVQISPLVERETCTDNAYEYNKYLILNQDIEAKLVKVYFEDKYPYVVGEKYRYMILFFDGTSKELKSYSLTNPDVLETL